MKEKHFETQAVHFGEMFGEKGSLNVPIYQNSTFKQKIPGKWEPFTYTRTNNPTEEALRKSLAHLENGTYGVVFSSGLAAVHATIELLSTGDHIVSAADVYGGTHRLFTQFAEKRGISSSLCTRATKQAGEERRESPPKYQAEEKVPMTQTSAWNWSLDTRVPREPENATIGRVIALARKYVSELRHRGWIQPRGIRSCNVP